MKIKDIINLSSDELAHRVVMVKLVLGLILDTDSKFYSV